MLFNSVTFIALFLPLSLAGWFLLQRCSNPLYAKLFLIGMSFWFYGYYNPAYLLLLLFSLAVNFSCSLAFEKMADKGRRLLLAAGLAVNLGLLFYFKYFHFFLDNCNFLFHTSFHVEEIALPLGISFFTFQQISFLVDRYWKKAPHYDLIDYACFITYFPQLIAGPIVLHNEFIPQLQERKNRKPDPNHFFDGISLFILGLGKKVLLADILALVVNAEYKVIPYYLDTPASIVTILCYVLELYFDFSGYCDMARGIGKMFGFWLPDNFNSPLKATSVKDFWRRWHMTLGRFLSTYIYIPLGGNRRGTAIKCRNLLIVFLACGLWHGANWTFVVWGLLNGLAVIWDNLFPRLRFRHEGLNQLLTGIYMTLTFAIFRSDSLVIAGQLFTRLFTGGWRGYLFDAARALQIPETYAVRKLLELKFPAYLDYFNLFCLAALLIISLLIIRGRRAEEWIAQSGRSRKGLFLLATVFTWSFISLSQVSTFLYFNF